LLKFLIVTCAFNKNVRFNTSKYLYYVYINFNRQVHLQENFKFRHNF
jgi:hypothetical protein